MRSPPPIISASRRSRDKADRRHDDDNDDKVDEGRKRKATTTGKMMRSSTPSSSSSSSLLLLLIMAATLLVAGRCEGDRRPRRTTTTAFAPPSSSSSRAFVVSSPRLFGAPAGSSTSSRLPRSLPSMPSPSPSSRATFTALNGSDAPDYDDVVDYERTTKLTRFLRRTCGWLVGRRGGTDNMRNGAEGGERPRNGRRRGRRRRRIRRALASAALAASIWTGRGVGGPPKAYAAAAASPPSGKVSVQSIRPGMTRSQVSSMEKGEEAGAAAASDDSTSSSPSSSSSSSTRQNTKRKREASKYTDYGDDDDDEFDENFDYEGSYGKTTFRFDESSTPSPSSSGTSGGGKVIATQADKAISERLAMQRTGNFASYGTSGSDVNARSAALTTKVALAIFVPTFGAQIVREYVRRRREEEYVKKGLEIMEAQRAEYFNITSPSAQQQSDSDVGDELKDLKKNSTKTGDEDDDEDDDDGDDEDDDDDENEPPTSSRSGSRRRGPKGGGDGGGDDGDGDGGQSGSGGGQDPGYGRPSEEDVDRLKRMFGKS